jgi:Tol biopolymer transport system component/tRNA A-37 threonylcarbamoyl transferase component Bud32
VSPSPSQIEWLVGRALSHYSILEKLGEGGMGVVYKARDTHLDRLVAIKVLPLPALDDEHRRSRFVREAKAASALNHPNIVTIYDISQADGVDFIAMEFVPGKTLGDVIGRKHLPLPDTLRLGVQIADALATAHAAGIIHRDIKPGNIMVTENGLVKVLDFGLAKLSEPVTSDSISTRTLLTAPADRTEEGKIVGTIAYMSPEQAQGKPTDARSDIFSFGSLLYEMAAGARAFRGDTKLSILSAILQKDPEPVSGVRRDVPPDLERIISRCLKKDVERRFQHMGDVRVALQELKEESESGVKAAQEVHQRVRLARRSAVIAAVVLAIAAAASLWWWRMMPSRLPFPQATQRQITFLGDADFPAISPDGKSVAYVTGRTGRGQTLWLRDLRGGQGIEIFRGSDIEMPRWSPDGSEIAFVLEQEPPQKTGVMVIPRLGGSPRFVAGEPIQCWSPDGLHLAVASYNSEGFRIVDRLSGAAQRISLSLSGLRWILGLDWSPGSGRLAILTLLQNGRWAIWTVRADGSEQHKVFEGNWAQSPRWSTAGDGLYFLQGENPDSAATLSYLAVKPGTGEAGAAPSTILDGLQAGGYFTLSTDGTRLTYTRSLHYSNLWLAETEDLKRSRQPELRPLTSGTATLSSLSASPDGKWLAFVKERQVYKLPLEGGPPVQLTYGEAVHAGTAWSPDSQRIAFGSNEGGGYKVWIMDREGGNLRQLARTQLSEDNQTIVWATDGRILYHKPGNRNFGILDPETQEEKPLLKNPELGWSFSPQYSPDGTKVALFWNREHPGLWTISLIDGSAVPVRECAGCWPAGWSPDGNSLYMFTYREGDTITSVPVGGGNPKTIATFRGRTDEAVVSRNGRNLLCNVAETNSDVWLVENLNPSRRRR